MYAFHLLQKEKLGCKMFIMALKRWNYIMKAQTNKGTTISIQHIQKGLTLYFLCTNSGLMSPVFDPWLITKYITYQWAINVCKHSDWSIFTLATLHGPGVIAIKFYTIVLHPPPTQPPSPQFHQRLSTLILLIRVIKQKECNRNLQICETTSTWLSAHLLLCIIPC